MRKALFKLRYYGFINKRQSKINKYLHEEEYDVFNSFNSITYLMCLNICFSVGFGRKNIVSNLHKKYAFLLISLTFEVHLSNMMS